MTRGLPWCANSPIMLQQGVASLHVCMLGRSSVTPFDFSVAGATPAPVLRTWHGRKLKGVHGRACRRKRWLFHNPEGQQDQPSQVFHHFAPAPFLRRSTYISHNGSIAWSSAEGAFRGHPRRCAEICRSTSYTYLNLCLSLEGVLAC